MARKKDTPCAKCGTLIWRPTKGQRPAGEATCRRCFESTTSHEDLVGTPNGHHWHRRRGEAACDPCRVAWNAACKETRAAARARGWVRKDRPVLDAKCLGCGKSVRGAYRKDRPYHRVCRERVERAERKRRAAAEQLARAAAGTVSEWVWTMGECAQCLQVFTRHGRPSRFCSTKCRQRARRSWKIATRDRLAIYERDGWICQLCEEPVDRDLMTTDPLNDWAPSLDHIEPQSHALIPDHSPVNLRLAHRWCNSVRGDLSYYTDADLRAA